MKLRFSTILSAVAIILAFSPNANAMVLAEARAKIGDCIAKPDETASVMSNLSAEDQPSFVAEVNAAISKLPGSTEAKSAKFLNVNYAALRGAKLAGDDADCFRAVCATVFTAASVESLCVLNESLAASCFCRTNDPTRVWTDAQYVNIASSLVATVAAKMPDASEAEANVRISFAALMMVRGSCGSPATLSNTLITNCLKGALAVDAAISTWFPAALETPSNYEPMLEYCAGGTVPNRDDVLDIVGPLVLASLLDDIADAGDKSEPVAIDPNPPVVPDPDPDDPLVPDPDDPIVVDPWDPDDDPIYIVPTVEDLVYSNKIAAICKCINPDTGVAYKESEVDQWLSDKGITKSAFVSSSYTQSSIMLNSDLVTSSNVVTISSLNAEGVFAFRVELDGEPVLANGITNMIEVCDAVGGTGTRWVTIGSQSNLVSGISVSIVSGFVTMAPAVSATNLFVRVKIPKD